MTNTIKLINLFSTIEATYDNPIVSICAEYTAPEFCHEENVTMPGCLAVVARHADGDAQLYAEDTGEYGDLNFTAALDMSNLDTMHFVYTNVRTGVVYEFDDPVDDPVDELAAGFDDLFDIQGDDSLPF